jgi:hypothetical protein
MKTKRDFDVKAFVSAHADEIAAIRTALATDFDTPAQHHINAGFSRMGVTRFVGNDDRWEQISCHLNGWEYERPPAHLQSRWASY